MTTRITVNGDSQELPGELSVGQLLEHLQLGAGRVAVELNGEIVPRSHYQQQTVRHGDRLEIVRAIGGG